MICILFCSTTTSKITMKFLQQNIKPLSLITICGCIGYAFGNPIAGVIFGIATVALVTLVL